MDAKAQEEEISLPVAVHIAMRSRYETDKETDRVIQSNITGIDSETLIAKGIDIPSGWHAVRIVPLSPENISRLQSLIAAEEALSLAQKELEGRNIGTIYSSYGRKTRTYSEALQILKQNYKRALNAESY